MEVCLNATMVLAELSELKPVFLQLIGAESRELLQAQLRDESDSVAKQSMYELLLTLAKKVKTSNSQMRKKSRLGSF